MLLVFCIVITIFEVKIIEINKQDYIVLQLKLAAGLEAASAARSLHLGPLTLTRDTSVPTRAARSEKQLEETLPRSMEERQQALDDLVLDKAATLLQTHSVKLNMDEIAPKEEGKRKLLYHAYKRLLIIFCV